MAEIFLLFLVFMEIDLFWINLVFKLKAKIEEAIITLFERSILVIFILIKNIIFNFIEIFIYK